MLIRQDFQPQPKLPPRMFLEQVMDNTAKAYCFLWDIKDHHNQINLTWKEVSRFYNKNNFRTSIRKMNGEGLLSYQESEDGIHIELIGWDEVVSG